MGKLCWSRLSRSKVEDRGFGADCRPIRPMAVVKSAPTLRPSLNPLIRAGMVSFLPSRLMKPWFARELSPGPMGWEGICQLCFFIELVPKRSSRTHKGFSLSFQVSICSISHSTKSPTSLNHIPALPVGATYSCPSGADPAATRAANSAKTTDFDRDIIKVLFLIIKRWREDDSR
jgi:hypothetical protein